MSTDTKSVEQLAHWLILNAGPDQIDQWNGVIAELYAATARVAELEARLAEARSKLAHVAAWIDAADADRRIIGPAIRTDGIRAFLAKKESHNA